VCFTLGSDQSEHKAKYYIFPYSYMKSSRIFSFSYRQPMSPQYNISACIRLIRTAINFYSKTL
jgi:hypothetical protein